MAEAAKSLNDALKDLVSDIDDIPTVNEVKGQGLGERSEEAQNGLSR